MTTFINASTSSGLVQTADTSAILGLQTNGTTALTIDTSANVGIGTTSPAQKLHVYGSGAIFGQIESSTATSMGLVLKNTAHQYNMSVGSGGNWSIYDATASADRIVMDTSGNVGIGITPSAKLDTSSGQILAGPTGNNAIAINSSGANYGFISNPSSGVFALGYGGTIGTLGTSVATWNSSGNFAFNSGYGSVATAYGCRAWVNFNGTGTPSIRASGNVSSITDNGTGNYTINFTNALVDANYSVSGIASDVGGTGNRGLVSLYTGVTNPAAGSFRIFTFADTTQTDNAYIYVSVFR